MASSQLTGQVPQTSIDNEKDTPSTSNASQASASVPDIQAHPQSPGGHSSMLVSTSHVIDNDFKVYGPSRAQAAPLPSLSEDYFMPSALELQAAQATLAARTNSLVNAPLQLRSKREEVEKAKRDRWPTTTIRVRFTDQTQLEKVFPSTNKIRTVYAFIRECLRDDVKPFKFVLFEPPKRELKVSDDEVRNLTLAELKLAPASVLLVRFMDNESLNKDSPPPLLQSILSQMVDLPAPPPEEQNSVAPSSEKVPTKSQLTSASNKVEKKLPKWLKLSKK